MNQTTELGKFKDVQALMSAYRALEAEFTRRSQKLRELEIALGKQESAATQEAVPASTKEEKAASQEAPLAAGTEKSERAETARTEGGERQELKSVLPLAGDPTRELLRECLLENNTLTDEQLFERVRNNPAVREKLLVECLSSGKSAFPMPEGGSVAAPANRPKTFAEAGKLTMQYFKGV